MSTTGEPGPLSVEGNPPPIVGPVSPTGGSAQINTNTNPDAAPSIFWTGVGIRDPRYRQNLVGSANVAGGYPNQDVGFYNADPMLVDQVPSAVATANIAALQAPVLNTPMTLVNASGAGITLLGAAFTVLATGLLVPAGSLAIDGNSNWVGAGQSGAYQFFDPTAGVARCVSLTSGANLSAINFTIKGYDQYGLPMTQTLAGPNVNTVVTKKAFKWVASITPSAGSASTVSVGTSDTYGFPLLVSEFAYVDILTFNNAPISSNAGFTVADVTTPATALTGDVRGTYALQGTTSDGVKSLQIAVRLSLANIKGPKWADVVAGMFGTTQF